MLDGRRRAGTRCGQTVPAEIDHRRGIPYARRSASGAARADANCLCRNLCVDYPCASRGRQGHVSTDARRFPIRARSLSRVVGAASRAARQYGWVAARTVSWAMLDCNRASLGRRRCSTSCTFAATGDVHMHLPERRALQDTVTAIRHRCTLAAAGHRLFPNGERHLRSYEQLRKIYPRELLDETLHVAQRCEFSLNELHYRYPRELVPPGMEASEHLRNLTERGLKMRWPGGL